MAFCERSERMGDERLAAMGVRGTTTEAEVILVEIEGRIPLHDRKRNDMLLMIGDGMLGTKKNENQMLTSVTATILDGKNLSVFPPPIFTIGSVLLCYCHKIYSMAVATSSNM